MNGCCFNPIRAEILGIIETTPPDPPVLSDYCVQWSVIADNIFFPCGTDNEINGSTDSGAICGGQFSINDVGSPNHTFYYDVNAIDGSQWYAQIIRPSSDPAPENLGTYSYDVFGNPSGPVAIPVQNSNCFINCYTATFEVNDVDTESWTNYTYNGVIVDMTGDVPFSDPGHEAWVLSQLIGRLEPTATYQVSLDGNTVTIIVTTIMTMIGGIWGTENGSTAEPFDFTTCP